MTLSQELVRKTLHVAIILVPISYYFLPRPLMLVTLGTGVVLCLSLDLARTRSQRIKHWFLSQFGTLLRGPETKGRLTGATTMVIACFVTIALFPKLIAIAALLFMILCDATAAIVGKRYGHTLLAPRKSLEGSLASLMVGVAIVYLIPGMSVGIGLVGAIVATVAELVSRSWDDNLVIPLASGAMMTFLA